MKIQQRHGAPLPGADPASPRDRAGRTGESPRSAEAQDRVHISGRGVEIRRARTLALQAPDIRRELVDEVVAQMESGTYAVTGAQVAPKMIQEHLALAAG
ncbi:MAG: hypothetical protein Kow0092_14420 [Deferrisomatales bacterium]